MTASGQPLAGTRVMLTRAEHQAGDLDVRLTALGAEVVVAPTIVIRPGDRSGLRRALRELAAGGYDLWCLTSPNGVVALAEVARDTRLDTDDISGGALVACVGPGTAVAARELLSLTVGLVPAVSTTSALAEAIPARSSGRALLTRAAVASEELPRVLRAKGYEVVEVTAYRTVHPPSLPDGVTEQLSSGSIDTVVVASPSAVRGLTRLLGDAPWSRRVVSIGPVTSAACRDAGLTVTTEARTHDLDGLTAAIVADSVSR